MLPSFLRVTLAMAIFGLITSADLAAQSAGDELRGEFPELGALFDAFDVTQAATFDELVAIGSSGDSQEAQDQLREALMMQSNMTMADMMQMGAGGGMSEMHMGPFGALETEALDKLTELVQAEHSPAEARSAFSNSGALTPRAAAVIERGRQFEARIFDIYADAGISDKFEAVNSAVDTYLSDSQLSVAAEPKSPALMYGHPYASAFRTGYPELSGLVWASQWLQLASLEPLMLGGRGSAVEDGIGTTIDRFHSKLEGMQGMTMLPTEIPMVPAISPLLLNRHREAAIIIDNLNLLETVIADLLVHPDVQNRSQSIDAVVNEFADRESNLADSRDYLLSALRTGIFNQGGPALGELARSERNRSRMQMEMGGHVSLPGMN